jgi:anti-sigma regulatory factor (Ser/Thr protein kinase)
VILVDGIDLVTGEARLVLQPEDAAAIDERLGPLAHPARDLGLHTFSVQLPGQADPGSWSLGAGRGPGPEAAAAPAPPGAALSHRAVHRGGTIRYEAGFAHRLDSARAIRAYTEFVLSAGGVPARELTLVRLATYELCVNSIEHGTPLGPEPRVEIGFEIDDRRVCGWVHDGCATFDPLVFQSKAVAQLAAQKRQRGYGLWMVRRIVDSIQHTHDGRGNLVTFTKELNDAFQ